MKWQLQCGRLSDLAASDTTETGEDDVDWQKLAAGLEAQAEGLYDLVEREDLWEITRGPLVQSDG